MSLSFKSLSQLLTGNIVVQLLNVAFYPIITRIYLPAELGDFGYFMSIVQMVGILATGQYHMAVVKEKQSEDYDAILLTSMIISLLTSISFLVISFFLDLPLILSLIVFFYSLSEIFKIRFFREGLLWESSKAMIINRVSSQIIKCGGFYWKPLLLWSELFGNLFASIFYFKADIFQSFHKTRVVLKKHLNYPLYFMPNLFMSVLLQEFPVLYFTHVFSSKEAGYFFLYNKTIAQPTTLLGNMIAQSMIKGVADAETEDEKREHIKSVFSRLMLLSLPFSLLTYFLAEYTIIFFFGNNYEITGRIAAALAFTISTKLLKGLIVVLTINSSDMRSFVLIKLFTVIIMGFYSFAFTHTSYLEFLVVYFIIDGVMDLFSLFLSFKQKRGLSA